MVESGRICLAKAQGELRGKLASGRGGGGGGGGTTAGGSQRRNQMDRKRRKIWRLELSV